MKCLTSYIDNITRNICPASLFKESPTIYFYPQVSADRKDDLKVLKSREKNVVTLDIGAFRARETILHDGNGGVYP